MSSRGGADLHTHSIYSDGTCSPEEIVERAAALGLDAVSLTDHDTVEGLDAFRACRPDTELELIPGLEISAATDEGSYHVLGYGIDPEHPRLLERLRYFQRERVERVRGMVRILREEMGEAITFEEIDELAGSSLVGKPHVARALVHRGIVDSVRHAFEELLGDGGVLDEVPKERMRVEEAVELIRAAGGRPVFAHPIFDGGEEAVRKLAARGVEGVEVYYPDHPDAERRALLDLAEELGLFVTGGSDFHGDVKPEIALGQSRLPPERYRRFRRVLGRA